MSIYREQLENWLKTIRVKTDRVLDLGGASNPVRTRVASWEVEECVFFDNGKEEAKVEYIPFDLNLPIEEQLEGYGLAKLLEDIDKLEEDKTKMPNPFRFDAVFCLEVFEYIYDPVQAIRNIWKLMNDDSVAYISFPAIYPVHQPVEIDYLRYTKQAIMQYLTKQGFTQIEVTAREATKGRDELRLFYMNEGMHPVRNSELPYHIGYLVKARKLGS